MTDSHGAIAAAGILAIGTIVGAAMGPYVKHLLASEKPETQNGVMPYVKGILIGGGIVLGGAVVGTGIDSIIHASRENGIGLVTIGIVIVSLTGMIGASVITTDFIKEDARRRESQGTERDK